MLLGDKPRQSGLGRSGEDSGVYRGPLPPLTVLPILVEPLSLRMGLAGRNAAVGSGQNC